MLIDKVDSLGLAQIMSELAIIAASTKTTLHSLAKQVYALGEGLQNAAPEKAGVPNKSVQYLLDIAESLGKIAERCDQLETSQGSRPKP